MMAFWPGEHQAQFLVPEQSYPMIYLLYHSFANFQFLVIAPYPLFDFHLISLIDLIIVLINQFQCFSIPLYLLIMLISQSLHWPQRQPSIFLILMQQFHPIFMYFVYFSHLTLIYSFLIFDSFMFPISFRLQIGQPGQYDLVLVRK